MTTRPDVSAPSPQQPLPREEDAELVLRRMMRLTDEIIADMRPLDGLCTLTLLLARHELARHLARLCDTSDSMRHLV